MSCPINCNITLGTHDSEDLICNGLRPAGGKDLILFICTDNITDINDPAEILAAIANDEAIEVFNVGFGSTAPTPTLGPKPFPCGVAGVLFNTYQFTITDYSYNQTNNALYTLLAGGNRVEAILVRDCVNSKFDDTSRFYDASENGGMSISGGLVDPADDEEAVRFEMTGSFKGDITILTTPAGVFT